jgi:hypothetical protein
LIRDTAKLIEALKNEKRIEDEKKILEGKKQDQGINDTDLKEA